MQEDEKAIILVLNYVHHGESSINLKPPHLLF